MKFEEMLAMAHKRLRDESGSDAEKMLPVDNALLYFNEAIDEACRRARLITDSSNPGICRIDVISGEPFYVYDERIVKIRRVMMSGRTTPLTRTTSRDLDETQPGWESHAGNPDKYCLDMESYKIRLHRIPVADAILSLTVNRLPLVPLVMGATPEIAGRYHAKLVSWVIFRVRDTDDTEAYDPRKAVIALKEFEQEFGEARPAHCEAFEDSQAAYEGEW